MVDILRNALFLYNEFSPAAHPLSRQRAEISSAGPFFFAICAAAWQYLRSLSPTGAAALFNTPAELTA
ncbi:MAG: hypothetical protein ACTFAL_04380 [Candidatus Electronema sp. V4]|uniref:hypothetical protein n=1 Tax=Candidatus Electronema sp. V4 TaxID=3454756 RepID=UPI0040554795